VAWQEQTESKGYLLQGIPLIEAVQFRDKQADLFALSDVAKTFIQKSLRHRRLSRLKATSWLLIPATLIVGLVEYNIWENRIRADYVSLGSENKSEQTQAVSKIVAGCFAQRQWPTIPQYFVERVFGNCRSLQKASLRDASLSDANLSDANLSFADLHDASLHDANLSYANLRYANLSNAALRNADLSYANLSLASFRHADLNLANLSNANLNAALFGNADLSFVDFSYSDLSFADFRIANLRYTNLSNADLSNANLSNTEISVTDLSDANLSDAIFLNTNLSTAKNLDLSQLVGKNSALMCNSPLPEGLGLPGGMNRDCDRLPAVLQVRYPDEFETSAAAAAYVAEQREKKWE